MRQSLWGLLLFHSAWGAALPLQEFDRLVEEERQAWNIPGVALGIVKDQEIVFLKGYGQRGIDNKEPVTAETLFQIGSLSKAFCSALTALGVDRGWLKWEDSVVDHFPPFRMQDPFASREFQIQDLFAQRSGLPPYAGDSQTFLGFTRDEMIHNVRYLKPSSSFRAEFAYQNIFFLVAAKVLEKQGQRPYKELLKEELFTPLKMTSTTTSVEEYLSKENRAEWLMRTDAGKNYRLADDFPHRNWHYELSGSGEINSNAHDMSQWLLFQINQGEFEKKRIVSAANMRRLWRPMIFMGEMGEHDEEMALYYALGWVHMTYSPHPIIWHDGSTLGVYNVAAFIPEEKLGIVILSNVRNTKLSFALALHFFDLYYGKAHQNWSRKFLQKAVTQEQKPREVTAPLPLDRYTGDYQHPVFGIVPVREEEGALILTLGKNREQWKLKPWDRDIFTFNWFPVEDKETKVLFLSDSSGAIQTMRIELFAKEGQADFVIFQQR